MWENRRPRILHCSGDFPDAFSRRKTSAIKLLCELIDSRFDQTIVSINRLSPSFSQMLELFGRRHLKTTSEWASLADGMLPVRYIAPPRGLFHWSMLERLADDIGERIGELPRPDLLLGHKLTIEGIVVQRLSQRLGLPYAITIQGNTDTRVLAARPDLREGFARIWQGAAVVFSFAPWASKAVARRLGPRANPTVDLPCPTTMDTVIAPVLSDRPDIVSAFHLGNLRLKNLPRLAEAARIAQRDARELRVSIIGDGSERARAEAVLLAEQHPSLVLEGGLPHEAMPGRLNRASGLAMPSLRESFGLVFVEALLAGCPIMYPAGRAVDGWFDDLPFAIRVDPRDTGAIARGLRRLVQDEQPLKEALAAWQSGPEAERFRRPAIARKFGDTLADAVQATASAR